MLRAAGVSLASVGGQGSEPPQPGPAGGIVSPPRMLGGAGASGEDCRAAKAPERLGEGCLRCSVPIGCSPSCRAISATSSSLRVLGVAFVDCL